MDVIIVACPHLDILLYMQSTDTMVSRKYINDVILWPAFCSGSEFHCGRMREQRPKLGPLSPFCGVVHILADTSGQGRFLHRCCMIIICPKMQLFKCSTCTIPFRQHYV